jgi:hypothetical protein
VRLLTKKLELKAAFSALPSAHVLVDGSKLLVEHEFNRLQKHPKEKEILAIRDLFFI